MGCAEFVPHGMSQPHLLLQPRLSAQPLAGHSQVASGVRCLPLEPLANTARYHQPQETSQSDSFEFLETSNSEDSFQRPLGAEIEPRASSWNHGGWPQLGNRLRCNSDHHGRVGCTPYRERQDPISFRDSPHLSESLNPVGEMDQTQLTENDIQRCILEG